MFTASSQGAKSRLHNFNLKHFKPKTLLFWTLALAWKDNYLFISQATAEGGKLSNCWICPQTLQSDHDTKVH